MVTTRSGSIKASMDKKRPIQDDNTIHGDAKKQKRHLSDAENKLLSLKRWSVAKSLPPKTRVHLRNMYKTGLYVIRQAYCSIRATGSCEDHIVKVLKDKAAMIALIGLANLFWRMKRFILCMGAIRTDLSTNLKRPLRIFDTSEKGICPRCKLIHAQVSLAPPEEQVRTENDVCSSVLERGDSQLSSKVYGMLLLLNKMLTQLGIQSAEGYGDAGLEEVLIRRMGLLRTEMEQEESLLIHLINSGSKSKCVSACDQLRTSMVVMLHSEVGDCKESVLSANKENNPALQKVIEFLHDTVYNWHSNVVVGRPSNPDELELFKKLLQQKLDDPPEKIWAALGIK